MEEAKEAVNNANKVIPPDRLNSIPPDGLNVIPFGIFTGSLLLLTNEDKKLM